MHILTKLASGAKGFASNTGNMLTSHAKNVTAKLKSGFKSKFCNGSEAGASTGGRKSRKLGKKRKSHKKRHRHAKKSAHRK